MCLLQSGRLISGSKNDIQSSNWGVIKPFIIFLKTQITVIKYLN